MGDVGDELFYGVEFFDLLYFLSYGFVFGGHCGFFCDVLGDEHVVIDAFVMFVNRCDG